MGIIGIVAALTIPTLMQKIDERETISKVKKMYSVISQAYKNYYAENGNPNVGEFNGAWNNESATYAYEIFKPYLKIAKECGVSDENGQCIYNDNYKNFNGQSSGKYSTEKVYKVLLSDGSAVIFAMSGVPGIIIYYDTNGPKGPNQYGKDFFTFYTHNDGLVLPAGITEYPFDTDFYEGSGQSATAWVLYKENMDYLKCDDLSWDGKQKCD